MKQVLGTFFFKEEKKKKKGQINNNKKSTTFWSKSYCLLNGFYGDSSEPDFNCRSTEESPHTDC